MRVFDDTSWRDVTVSGVVQSPEYLWPARDRQDVLGDPHAFAVVFAPEPLARTLAEKNKVFAGPAMPSLPKVRDHSPSMVRSESSGFFRKPSNL